MAPIRLRWKMSRLTLRTVKLVDGASCRQRLGRLHVERAVAPWPGAPEQAASGQDRDVEAVVQADAPAVEEQRRRARVLAAALHAAAAPVPPLPVEPLPKLKVSAPSRKKSRFSGKSRLNRVRLTCCSSSSTCAKSVLTVMSAMSVCWMPHFRSKPMFAVGIVEVGDGRALVGRHRAERVRLQVDVPELAGHLRVPRPSPPPTCATSPGVPTRPAPAPETTSRSSS